MSAACKVDLPSREHTLLNGFHSHGMIGVKNSLASSVKNGMASSVKNGLASGTKNGLASSTRNGLSNGARNGVKNGLSNGVKNGHPAGVQNGFKNGVKGNVRTGSHNGSVHKMTPAKSKPSSDERLSKEAQVERGYRFLFDTVPLMVKNALQEGTDSRTKVVEFKYPEELRDLVDLKLPAGPTDNATMLDLVRQIIRYSVKTGHPRFFNQLFGGIDPFGLTGAWLTEALNTSSYTYEMAPVFTLMEREVTQEMLRLIGFPDGEAIFCPGGSMSNMYAINLARYRMFPEVKRTGLSALPPLCIMTSEKAHYSIAKGAAFLGLGTDNVIKVKTDSLGRMDPQALDEALHEVKAQGRVPIMVSATAGTTVLGAYDPLMDLADVCQKHGGLWLHVDGAWGGAVLLSPTLRHKLAGLERADSMTWNPHKMMGAPLQCSGFFTKQKGLLQRAHCANATYLFQQDKFYDVSYDTGDMSLQCGRKVDCLKLWLMWKAHGTEQMAQRVEHLFQCAEYLTQKLKAHEGYRLIVDKPECTNVCFWFIPPSMRGQPETPEWWIKLGKVAPAIKQRMAEQGTMMVGYQPEAPDRVNFFRMVLINHAITFQDMDFVVSEIARLGHDL